MKNQRTIVTILFALLSISLYSQEFSVSGIVKSDKGEPIYFATVHQKDGSRHTMTDEKGFFKIKLSKGKSTLVVSCMGYAHKEMHVNVTKDIEELKVTLKELTLSLNEVVVNATAVESKSGTGVYEIGEQAIKQVQAMNLSDILKLLPGKQFTPADMNSVLQADIRTAASSTANNFGTSVILDGAQISNDANMQAQNPAISLSGGKEVVGRGIDLRSITTSGIEKVEVVSGVASPKYGDLTSGAILVKSKVGKSPLVVSANLNPNTYQFSINIGVQLKGKLGFLTTDLSYTYSNQSPIDNKEYYNNVNAGLRWRTTLNKIREWTNTVSFQLYTSNNGQKFDPDETYERITKVRSQRYMLNINGSLKLLGTTSYTLSGSIQNQYSYFKTLQVDGPFPMTDGLEAGTFFTTYSPLVYDQTTEIKGLPTNFNARLEADQIVESGNYRISFNSGVQFSYNKNYGKGRVSSGNVAGVQGSLASRSAKFHEIPASQAISAYHESKAIRITEKMRHELRLGLRYDYMNNRYNLLSPRLSFNSLLWNKLKIRGSWGISYKAPAMMQLYPGPSYYDYTNLDYYANDLRERLAIVSTYIYQPNNKHLKPSKGDIKEIGIDWSEGKFKIRTTYYHKTLSNGIYHSSELLVLNKQLYRIIDKPVGRQPIVQPIEGESVKILRKINHMKNIYTATTDGVELMISPPKIEATNTQIDIRLTYIETLESDDGFGLQISSYPVGEAGARYGVYERPIDRSKLSNGNITIIQHIPSLRLV
ncbi:MAG: TonB-dependent receptor, partial [Bacteroidales bacterium]